MERKRAFFLGSDSSAVVGARHSVFPSPRRHGPKPSLVSAQIPSGSDGEMSSEAGAAVEMKVRPVIPSPAPCGTTAREIKEQAACPRSSFSVGGGSSSCSNSCSLDTIWPYESSAVVSGCLGVIDNMQAEGAEKNLSVELELQVSSPPS